MRRRSKKSIFIVILIILCVAFLISRVTYSSYESDVSGRVESDVAGWKVKINDVLVSDEVDKNVSISDIDWTNSHIKPGKLAPGATGKFNIHLDFTGTDVAVRFDIEVIDKSMDPDKILTLTSVDNVGISLTRTGVSTYTGIVPKNQLNTNPRRDLVLNLEWINDDNVNDLDTVISDDQYITVNFRAVQYRGEALVPYSG